MLLALHHCRAPSYFWEVYRIPSLNEISPREANSVSHPLVTQQNLGLVLQIGHLFTVTPWNTLSSSFRSFIQFLLTSGKRIAHKPHPKNGTHFNCCFAKYRH